MYLSSCLLILKLRIALLWRKILWKVQELKVVLNLSFFFPILLLDPCPRICLFENCIKCIEEPFGLHTSSSLSFSPKKNLCSSKWGELIFVNSNVVLLNLRSVHYLLTIESDNLPIICVLVVIINTYIEVAGIFFLFPTQL